MSDNSNPFGKPTNENTDDDNFEFNVEDELNKFRIPEGEYQAKCVALTKSESKAGNAMWVFDFAITTTGEQAGKELKVWCALTPAALWKLTETTTALGFPPIDGKLSFKHANIINKTCKIEVVTEKDNQGNPRTNIKRCLPL